MSGHEADDKRDGDTSGDRTLSAGITQSQRLGIVDVALELVQSGLALERAGASVQEMGRNLSTVGSRANGLARSQFAAECLAIAGIAGDVAETLRLLQDELRATAKQVNG